MTLYSAVLDAQRQREADVELSATWRTCRAPTCNKRIWPHNRCGFCTRCAHYWPGRRWYLLENPSVHGKRLAAKRRWGKAHRDARTAAGLCLKCEEPNVPGKPLCERHREMAMNYQRMRRAMKRGAA